MNVPHALSREPFCQAAGETRFMVSAIRNCAFFKQRQFKRLFGNNLLEILRSSLTSPLVAARAASAARRRLPASM